MKFQTRMAAGNITMLLMFVVVFVYVFVVLNNFRKMEAAQAKTVELIQLSGDLKGLMHEIEASVRNFMLTGKKEYLTPYYKMQKKYDSQTGNAVQIAQLINIDASQLSSAHELMQKWYKQEAEPSILDRQRFDMSPQDRIKAAGAGNALKVEQVLDPKILREFQRLFYKMTGMANLVLEMDGKAVKEQSFKEFSKFCFGLVRATKKGAAWCKENDIKGGKVAMQTGKPYVYTCNAGLVDFSVPIIVDGVQIGSWAGGQVLTKEPDPEHFKKIAAELGIDEAEMLEAVRRIPVLKPERVESAAQFLQLLANSQSEVGNTNHMWSKITQRLDSGVGQKILSNAEEKLASFVDALKQIRKADQLTMASSLQNLKVLLWAGLIVFVALSATILYLTSKIIRTQIGGDPKAIAQLASRIATGDESLTFDDAEKANGIYLAIIKMHQQLKEIFAKMHAERVKAEERAEAANKAEEEANNARVEAEKAKSAGMFQAAHQLESIVEIITAASEQLSAQIEQSSRGADDQSHHVSETATSMEEMNATVLEVAKNASNSASTADTSRDKAEEGASIVGQVVEGIEQVQHNSREIKNDMGSLGRQAEGIGQILNVISDIADQTNLLALNAAIEAARAGEAGRGFAVVADEVRKLAEKTMTATKEVGEAIRGIQDGTRQNIDNVERSVKHIEEVTTLATRSGESLREIVSLAEKTTDQVRSIAAASEQQSAASEEINRSLGVVNRISTETAEAMKQSSQAVTELANQAQILKGLIAEMKSEGGNASLPGASGEGAAMLPAA